MSKGKKRTTRKVQRYFEGRTLIDAETGEEVETMQVHQEARDFDFQKIWVSHLLDILDEFGSAKMEVLLYIFSNLSGQNVLLGTVEELAEAVDRSTYTVSQTLQILESHDIIKRRRGYLRVNPDVIFKGRGDKRMSILYTYESMDAEEAEEVQKEGYQRGEKEAPRNPKKAFREGRKTTKERGEEVA